jgi:phosphatidylserine/phosphatidylglycerophosphate/cardiolipin synthase-like enzyme
MASVGSTHFDTRSFELNDEASLNVDSPNNDRGFRSRRRPHGFGRVVEALLLPIRAQL